MVTRGRKRRVDAGPSLLLGLTLAACSGTTPPSEIAAPALDLVSVFYPVNGDVHGRGLPGALGTTVERVRVRAHPTGTERFFPVALDGSFTFEVKAVSDDVLELSAEVDGELGAPAFLRVPPSPLPLVDYVCCAPAGTCQRALDAEAELECPVRAAGARTCEVDADCGVLEGEYLALDTARIRVTPPDARGVIDVSGIGPPRSLVILQNRGLSALGERTPRQRFGQVTDDRGNFVFSRLPGRGDDELVLQVQDLGGYRSPQVSVLVPDSELAGLDVIGAFAWDTLTNGQTGRVAINLAPFGLDGRGICPDTKEPPSVCFSGGLTHAMISLENVTVDGQPATPIPSATSSTTPYNRGLEGQVRSGARDILVLLDLGSATATRDPEGRRFELAASFIEAQRRRDRVAVMVQADAIERLTVAETNGVFAEPGLRTAEQRPALAQAVRALIRRDVEQAADPYALVRAGAQMLRTEARSLDARIVLITGQGPRGTEADARMAFRAAYEAVNADVDTGFRGYAVDVIALGFLPGEPGLTDFEDLAAFTAGRLSTAPVEGLEQALTDLVALTSGSFILLYDLPIPASAGKSARIRFDVEAFLGGSQRVRSSYTGPVQIQNSSN